MEKAYIAGLFDGEGSITLSRNHANQHRSPVVSVSNNFRELLDPLIELYGGCLVNKPARKETHQHSFDWRITNRRTLPFLRDILPYMRHPEKLRRAMLILSEYLDVTPRNGKYTPEILIKRKDFEYRFFCIPSKGSKFSHKIKNMDAPGVGPGSNTLLPSITLIP